MAQKNFITLKNVDYYYDIENYPDKKALDNINISIASGEYIAVLGHNGSGKSTFAKLLNGLILPTNGDVLVNGLNTKDEDSLNEIRRSTGMVFQNPDNQMVATLVEEDVAFGVENLGIPAEEIRKRIDESLDAVGMLAYKDKKPHQLSGGQKQRIAIAGVLAMNPQCIIFDESTAMLDPAGREDVLEIIEKLNDEGVTIILITHNMEETITADRVVILNDGKIEMSGTPSEVFREIPKLRQLRLDAPEIVEIADILRNGGLNLPDDILSAEELVDALCQLK